jgi:glutamate synthase (NADPH/NADH) large chain
VRGVAGERFAVRNSGVVAVVEGLGDHGCEYMTGGVVVVLGNTGRNFAAGMSGGVAYVLNESDDFPRRCNMAMVELEPIADEDRRLEELDHQGGDLEGHGKVDLVHDMTRNDASRLHSLIERHCEYTGSERAAEILANWDAVLPKFVKVMPVEYRRALEDMEAVSRAAERGVSAAVGG